MTEGGELRRELGLADAVLLSVGGMVGAAIFVFPGSTGQLAGPAAIGAWFAAGLLMLAIALLYTELSLAFPAAGGPAVFPYETWGGPEGVRAFASYLEGVSYSIGWAFAITVSALAIADYLAIMVPGVDGATVPVALVAIALSLAVNLAGVDMTSRTNLMLSAGLLAVLAVFVAAGLANATPANYAPVLPGSATGFLAAVQIAITAYGAWTVIPSAAAEIRDPGRTVPRAIILSLLTATVLYTGTVAAVHGTVPATAFVPGSEVMSAPLGVAARSLGLPVFEQYILPLAAITAIFTTMLVGTMGAGRVLLALGRNGTLPGMFARVSRRGVPVAGLAAVSSLAAVFAAFPQYFYQLLVVAAIVGTGIPYAINIVSFIWLRRRRDDVSPAFRAPGGMVLPVVAFGALAITMIGLGATEVVWSAGTVAVIAASFVVQRVRGED